MGGLTGVYLYEKDCYDTLLHSAFHLQHRGTESSALDTSKSKASKNVRAGEVKKAFSGAEGAEFSGNYGLASVSGGKTGFMRLSSKMGKFSLAFAGRITNSKELKDEMKRSGESFAKGNTSEILARLISKGKDVVDGIKKMSEEVEGSYTILILNNGFLYATRDPRGILPLAVGKREDGVAVSSESPSLVELGFDNYRDVEPGEILRLGKEGVEKVGQLEGRGRAHCAFEWMYTARPDSVIQDVEAMGVRRRAGRRLAEVDDVEGDKIGPVPQSGIGYAIGYHQGSKIPYEDFFYLNRFSKRSYIPADPEVREQVAKEKLSVIRSSTKGKKLVLGEDSIVRGNQMIRLRDTLKKKGGAKEVHARIGCPPITEPCPYTETTNKRSNLIYNRYNGSVEKICEKLNLDSLTYNSPQDVIDAIGLPREELCMGCLTGNFPTQGER
ncbi:MAG: amidophosphoribosyltransferase [Candidatus Aenigmatarchaeota archaeon]